MVGRSIAQPLRARKRQSHMDSGEAVAIATTSPLPLTTGSGEAGLLLLFERPLEE